MSDLSETQVDRQQISTLNLSVIEKEIALLEEEKQLLLREYFERPLLDNISFSSAANQLRSVYWAKRKEGKKSSRADAIKEKLLVASLLTEHYTLDDLIQSEEILQNLEKRVKVAYWASNRHSVVAYDRFSALFEETQRAEAESFTHVCEQVSGGDVDFGILPIENSTDGRLVGFYRMLEKYELKICAVCNIEDDSGENFTRFALLSRVLCRLDSKRSRWIELSATSSNAARILELITVAENLGMAVKRLSSIPLYYRGNACVDTLTLAVSEETAFSFFVYLYLFGKDISILGLFIQI